MDYSTASYYRAILFRDSQDQRPLPPSLVLFHQWAFKCCQAMGVGSVISKQSALGVAMTWLSSTKEGRAFALEHTILGDLFSDQADDPSPADAAVVDWDSVTPQSKVVVIIDQKPTAGEFMGRRGSWIDIRVGGDTKPYRTSQVQLSGA